MASKRESAVAKSKPKKANPTRLKKANRTSFKNEAWYQSIAGAIGISASKNSAAH
jgi:hypothetical protein